MTHQSPSAGWCGEAYSRARWTSQVCQTRLSPISLAPQPAPTPQQAASFIYLCDPRTEGECLERLLFGLPMSQAQAVSDLVPEVSYLFLFNVRASAASHGPRSTFTHRASRPEPAAASRLACCRRGGWARGLPVRLRTA